VLPILSSELNRAVCVCLVKLFLIKRQRHKQVSVTLVRGDQLVSFLHFLFNGARDQWARENSPCTLVSLPLSGTYVVFYSWK